MEEKVGIALHIAICLHMLTNSKLQNVGSSKIQECPLKLPTAIAATQCVRGW